MLIFILTKKCSQSLISWITWPSSPCSTSTWNSGNLCCLCPGYWAPFCQLTRQWGDSPGLPCLGHHCLFQTPFILIIHALLPYVGAWGLWDDHRIAVTIAGQRYAGPKLVVLKEEKFNSKHHSLLSCASVSCLLHVCIFFSLRCTGFYTLPLLTSPSKHGGDHLILYPGTTTVSHQTS